MDLDAIDDCTRRRIARREELASELQTLIRYGSAERGDFVPGVSDLDYFAVVESDEEIVAEVRDVLDRCLGNDNYRELDVAWEYADNLPDPYAGVPFKFLTIYQEDFRRHHTLVYGEDVVSDLPEYEFEDELPRRLDRIERIAEERADAPRQLRLLAGECARLRALVDGAESLRKQDVLETLDEYDRTAALDLYTAYVAGEPIEHTEAELRAFIVARVEAMRTET